MKKIIFEATPVHTHIGGGFAWSGCVIKLPEYVGKQKYNVTLEPVEPELKPCPFCGGKPEMDIDRGLWRVLCRQPNCDVIPHTRWAKHKENAIEAWNRRA